MGICCGKPESERNGRSNPRANNGQDKLAYKSEPSVFEFNRQQGSLNSKLRTDALVKDIYKLEETLGTGGFSVVKLAVEISTNRKYACKVMKLPEVGTRTTSAESTREDIFKEIEIMVGLDHENVVYLKEYFQEGNVVYLIMELLTGGELLDAVLAKGSYSEADACLCMLQLLRGLCYLHSQWVAHRDVKLENLLLAAPADITSIKIADFGLAAKTEPNGTMTTVCGTPQYVAPEVIVGDATVRYTHSCDIWAAGVVLFVLLGGYPPFYDEDEPRLFNLIRAGHLKFDDPVWNAISPLAKDLVSKLLVADPGQRLSAQAALEHPWLRPDLNPSQRPLRLTQENFKQRMPRRQFKGAVLTIIAQQRMKTLADHHNAAVPQ